MPHPGSTSAWRRLLTPERARDAIARMCPGPAVQRRYQLRSCCRCRTTTTLRTLARRSPGLGSSTSTIDANGRYAAALPATYHTTSARAKRVRRQQEGQHVMMSGAFVTDDRCWPSPITTYDMKGSLWRGQEAILIRTAVRRASDIGGDSDGVWTDPPWSTPTSTPAVPGLPVQALRPPRHRRSRSGWRCSHASGTAGGHRYRRAQRRRHVLPQRVFCGTRAGRPT